MIVNKKVGENFITIMRMTDYFLKTGHEVVDMCVVKTQTKFSKRIITLDKRAKKIISLRYLLRTR